MLIRIGDGFELEIRGYGVYLRIGSRDCIKQLTIGGRLHHGQVFRDYMMIDYFARDPDGLAIALLDPETDQIVSGVKDVDLGGYVYTAWSDKDYEYIYALMEPINGKIEHVVLSGRRIDQ